MVNRKRSFSDSCSNMENATSSILEASQLRAPAHRRSASDSLSSGLDLITPVVGDNFTQGEYQLEPYSSGDDTTSHEFNHNNEISENSSFPSEKSPSSRHGVITRFSDLSSETDKIKKRSRGFCDSGIDSKNIKRALANRESAQRCQLRKKEYIDKLKREIGAKEARLSMMSSQVSYYKTRCQILKMKNNEMKG
ncbi:hypothetical protein Patl1_31401 [Pistacia atlantica]|uniref:Uncharacterized protein n=1 Tax=Pistacia atlantica TaxID=434234 RepID=A0ACC1ANM4_9ROSI|nr:hypothetical protein Patl1_31401 [Pistacia atlantica]